MPIDARTPPLGSRVRASVTPCGFSGGRNRVWVGFSRGFSHLPLPQISFHYFSTLFSLHFISTVPAMKRQGVRRPRVSSHRIASFDPALCWTRGYLFIYSDIVCHFKTEGVGGQNYLTLLKTLLLPLHILNLDTVISSSVSIWFVYLIPRWHEDVFNLRYATY